MHRRYILKEELISIAIDGPAGAGKSTISKKVADILNIEYVDTGAMFRAITLKVLDNGIDIEDENAIIEILPNTDIDFLNNNIYLDGKNVNKQIRENKISQNASYIAKISKVRKKLLEIQRNIAISKSVIMDGRDIGTVVLPNAKYKFYLTASVDERANRRYKELLEKNVQNITLEGIKEDIIKRDAIDSNREEAPLKQAEDAILLDTTRLNIDETIKKIVDIVNGR